MSALVQAVLLRFLLARLGARRVLIVALIIRSRQPRD